MTRRIAISAVFLALGGNSIAAISRTDSQYWSEVDTTASIAPQAAATVLATSRFGDGLPNPTLFGGGLQLDLFAGPWTFSGADLFVGIRSPASGGQTDVQLPLCAVTYSFKIAGFTISDRNRIERLDGIPGSPSRYRNRLGIDIPTPHAGPVSHVFVTDEGFYDITTSQWNRNRAQAGIGLPLGKSRELQVFFLRQDNRSGAPRSLNVMGTTLKIFL